MSKNLAYIPAALDDYGLNPSAFRIYCHIARRAGSHGRCFERLTNIAEACGLSVWSARPCLNFLIKQALLSASYSPGCNAGRQYKLNPPAKWTPLGKTPRTRKIPHEVFSNTPLGKFHRPPRKISNCIYKVSTKVRIEGSGFTPPNVEEIKLQCAKIGLPDSEASRFFDYYKSKGWVVGRSPMRNWQAALNNWKRNYDDKYGNSKLSPQNIRNFGTASTAATIGKKIADKIASQSNSKPLPQAMATKMALPGCDPSPNSNASG